MQLVHLNPSEIATQKLIREWPVCMQYHMHAQVCRVKGQLLPAHFYCVSTEYAAICIVVVAAVCISRLGSSL
jgi:hypothetical protein